MNIRVRRTDPQTSVEAAESVLPKLAEKQKAVLDVLRLHRALSDHELIYWYDHHYPRLPKQTESGLRTRRKELVDMGLVHDSGERQTLATGRKSIVWRARADV